VNKLFNYLNKHWVKREKDEGRKEVYTVYTVRQPVAIVPTAECKPSVNGLADIVSSRWSRGRPTFSDSSRVPTGPVVSPNRCSSRSSISEMEMRLIRAC
jgi:hypothetical protein